MHAEYHAAEMNGRVLHQEWIEINLVASRGELSGANGMQTTIRGSTFALQTSRSPTARTTPFTSEETVSACTG